MKIPAAVVQKLGHYVYLYVSPLDNKVFYVGKGKGSRALAHLEYADNKNVGKRIREIQRAGKEPRIEILAHALPSADVALRIETAAIDLLGLSDLTNQTSGWKSSELGRAALDDLIAKYTRQKAKITEPAILIRINQLFRFGMEPVELYDATRGIWKIGEDRNKAEYAFAVYQGVIREAYSIAQWLPAGSTFSTRENHEDFVGSDRWEFVGKVADAEIRNRYVNKFVGHLFPYGFQSPIKYVNVKDAE
jgi:hypothetical protein